MDGHIPASPDAEATFELALEFRDQWINDPPSETSRPRSTLALRLHGKLHAAGADVSAPEIRGISETGIVIQTYPDGTRKAFQAWNVTFKWTPDANRPNYAQLEFDVDSTETRATLHYLIPILVVDANSE